MKKRVLLPYIVIGLAVSLAGWWWLRPMRDSELALRQFAPAMFKPTGTGCAHIVNGTTLLSEEQSEQVLSEIVRPLFKDARLVSVLAERRSDGHSSAQIQAVSGDGRALFVALNAFDLEDGGAIPLYMLLQRCWQSPVIARLGQYPENDAEFDQAYKEGISSAGRKLRQIGIDKIYFLNGKFMTAQEIADYYEQRIRTRSENRAQHGS